jgi:hypothetical protein
MIGRILTASAIAALAVSTPSYAQGSSARFSPLAWVDDATTLDSGGVSAAISTYRWSGNGMSEVSLPVVDVALGLAPRVQLSASVPRINGSADPNGALGGLGTSYFTTKLGVLESRDHLTKLAVSPTLEVLTPGAAAATGPNQHRVQLGIPVSAEIDRGPFRLYGATGYFTRGAWFTGAGVGFPVNDRIYVSSGVSRAWRTSKVPNVPLGARDRKELTSSASYGLTDSLRVFGSFSRAFRTLPENGAGTTIGGGVSLFFTTPVDRPRVK